MPMLPDPSIGSIATATRPSGSPAITPSASSERIDLAPASVDRVTK